MSNSKPYRAHFERDNGRSAYALDFYSDTKYDLETQISTQLSMVYKGTDKTDRANIAIRIQKYNKNVRYF